MNQNLTKTPIYYGYCLSLMFLFGGAIIFKLFILKKNNIFYL